jgi:L-fuculose-phosphate aldolase
MVMALLSQHKKRMCDIGKRMWQRGLVAGFDGNLSVRLGADRVLCTPTGVAKGFLKPGELCVINMDGERVSGGKRVTSEILLHLEIYRVRADAGAVVHAHPPHATAFACSGAVLPERVYPEADYMLGRVVRVPYRLPGNRELSVLTGSLVTPDCTSILLNNHGSVHIGRDLEEAYCYLEVLDAYCRILLMIRQIGQVRRISEGEFRELLELKVGRGGKDSRLSVLCRKKGQK